MTNQKGFVVRLTPEDTDGVLAAARNGDMSKAHTARETLRANRAKILNELGTHPPETVRLMLTELLTESRNSEADLNGSIQHAMDGQHAARMADLADVSNAIATRADAHARSLTIATWVLAVATVGLVAATAALIVVTLRGPVG